MRQTGDQETRRSDRKGQQELKRSGGQAARRQEPHWERRGGIAVFATPSSIPREMVLARIMLRWSLMDFTDEQINCIVEKSIGCGIEVHREFGPGLLESVYRECFGIELKNAELDFEMERQFPLKHKGMPIKSRFQVDFVVEDAVIVELKSIEAVHPTSRKS